MFIGWIHCDKAFFTVLHVLCDLGYHTLSCRCGDSYFRNTSFYILVSVCSLWCFRIPGELGPVVRMLNPPQTYAQAERQMNLVVPKFKNAAITPTMRPIHWTPPQKDIDDVQVYKRLVL